MSEKKYEVDEKISLYLMDLKPEGNLVKHLADLTTIMVGKFLKIVNFFNKLNASSVVKMLGRSWDF